jgi:hypothetical protein
MRYRRTIPFLGRPEVALREAARGLLSGGLRVTEHTDQHVVLDGPGMRSRREPALAGATHVEIHYADKTLELRAELGGVERVVLFMWLFPLSVAFGLLVVLSMALWQRPSLPYAWITIGLAVLPSFVLAPIRRRRLARRTCHALDDLLLQAAGGRSKEDKPTSRPKIPLGIRRFGAP